MYKKLLITGVFALFAYGAAGSEVIVDVDGIQITQDDVRRYIHERIASGANPESFKSARSIAQAGENLLSLRRLGKMAREAGFAKNEQIEWELELQRERLQHREWVQSIVDKEMAATNWEAVAKEEYLANPNSYVRGQDEIRASHILIGLEKRNEEEALLLATDVLKRVKGGEDFISLAKEFSDDRSVEENEGDLGFFSKGRMVPEFEMAAFALSHKKPISDVVKTQFGYHIIKYTGARKAKKLTFDEAKGDIINRLKSQLPRTVRGRLAIEARSVSNEEANVNEAALRELEKEILAQ